MEETTLRMRYSYLLDRGVRLRKRLGCGRRHAIHIKQCEYRPKADESAILGTATAIARETIGAFRIKAHAPRQVNWSYVSISAEESDYLEGTTSARASVIIDGRLLISRISVFLCLTLCPCPRYMLLLQA